MANMNKVVIFNIQRYSIHDGPGIRTIVFLKGCPLRCRWCSNPESQQPRPQLSQNRSLCIGCLRCLSTCKLKALTAAPDGIKINRNLCSDCLDCTKACAAGALTAQGREVTVEGLLPELLRDRSYFEQSGGGVTLSGGEPLFQDEFAVGLLSALKQQGIHTAIETTGCVEWEVLSRALPYTDVLLFDLKHMDSDKHEQGTGVGNALILENLKKALSLGAQVIIRIPLIPGFNADDQSVDGFIKFIKGIGSPSVGLLPFHQLGSNKYAFLDKVYSLEGKPQMQPEEAEAIRLKFKSAGIAATVGG